MRRVIIVVLTRAMPPLATYDRISDFVRYEELTTAVQKVVVHPEGADGSHVSDWTVRFRNGLLCWTENDTFDIDQLTIAFTQTAGDFERFEGGWRVEAFEDGSRVTFDAVFDLGIPSLADILDPVAERTLRENMITILRGLLGEIEVVEEALEPS
jgi:ribosome-associated toxin RatA of RatAB toxin-antitoxin module